MTQYPEADGPFELVGLTFVGSGIAEREAGLCRQLDVLHPKCR